MIAVILAAGLGTRMKSRTIKMLHRLLGKPLCHYPVELARKAGCGRVIVVCGHQRGEVETSLAPLSPVEIVEQREQRGTADALRSALPLLASASEPVLLLYGDVPLLSIETVASLGRARGDRPLAMVTMRPADPTGYGRIVRDGERVTRVVEQKDATDAERAIREVNAGIYVFDTAFLARELPSLPPSPVTGEVYLTDIVARAAAQGGVATVEAPPHEALGINDRTDLATAASVLRWRIALGWMREGVTLHDPDSTWIEPGVRIGADTEIGACVELRGATVVGAGCRIERGSIITDSRIADGVTILPYCVIADSVVGAGARLGPFSHLRPGSDLGERAHVGNFVELKKARLAAGAKANHLAYLGDADVGERVNVGAGTITCNYDGTHKHVTVIEEEAFIGSDTQLVAPVRIGKGAYVGAGSTITKDVPAGALALTRPRQKHVEGYAERRKARDK